MSVAFRPEILDEFEKLAARYPERKAALLPALRFLEREFGTITDEGMIYVARLVGVTPAKVFGVHSFYTHFRRATDGKYVLWVCSTLPCVLRGSQRTYRALCDKLGIEDGQTTPDGLFTIKKAECLAACDRAPVVQVNDRDVYDVTPELAAQLVEELSNNGR